MLPANLHPLVLSHPLSLLAEESEPVVVRLDPREEAFVGIVGDAVLPARLLDDAGERRIVDVAYLREQVMLHLIVEPPQVPRKEMVVLVKISGGAQLMYHPGRIHLFRFPRVHGEPRVFVAVGELEHDRHYEPLEECHEHIEYDDVEDGIEEERYHESHREKEQLPAEKDYRVPSPGAVYLVPVYLLCKKGVEVVEQVPLDREEPVQGPNI